MESSGERRSPEFRFPPPPPREIQSGREFPPASLSTGDFVDATIAATCLVYGLVLATYNVRHYPMSGLRKAAPPS